MARPKKIESATYEPTVDEIKEPERRCDTCKFWGLEPVGRIGSCLYGPPIVSDERTLLGSFPRTYSGMFCFRWEGK